MWRKVLVYENSLHLPVQVHVAVSRVAVSHVAVSHVAVSHVAVS